MLAQSTRDYIASGNDAFERQDYYNAAMMYSKALDLNRNLNEIMFKCGEAYRLDQDYKRAENYYLKLVGRQWSSYTAKALFRLAETQKSLGKYQKAQKHFRMYLEKYSEENPLFTELAEHEIIACEKSLDKIFNPIGVKIEPLNDSINTPYGEFGGSIICDSMMFYASLEKESYLDTTFFVAKIYKAKYINGDWLQRKALDTAINTPMQHVANPFYDLKTGYLYFSKRGIMDKLTHLYRSKLINGEWQYPEKLTENINKAGYSSTQAFITDVNNKRFMLFASNMPGGKGGYDIWYAPINIDNEIGEAVNLKSEKKDFDEDLAYLLEEGVQINSPVDEITPFYDNIDSVLYFSSKWHYSMGGFDVFKSKGQIGGKWSEPENLGYPINTPTNDVYAYMDNKRKYAYLSSNRIGSKNHGKESCCNDIYKRELYFPISKKDSLLLVKKQEEQKIQILKDDIEQLVPISLYFHNDEPDPRTRNIETDKNYESCVNSYLKRVDNYKEKYSHKLRGEEKAKAVDEITDFFSQEVEKGYNKLIEFSERLINLLDKGEEVKITLKGYASPLTTGDYNEKLAMRRISSIKNFFYAYQDGVFMKYIDKGTLYFEELAFGESEADEGVSDDAKDTRNSIYSPQAGKERKIKLLAIKFIKN